VKLTRRRLLGLATAGLLMAPIFASSIASADTASTTLTSVVTGAITAFTTSSTVAIAVASASGTKQTVNTDVVTISTNNSTGYTLKLEDGNNSDALCTSPGLGCTGIPATAGTFAVPAIMSGVNQWGYHIDPVVPSTTWCSTATNCGTTFGTSLSSNQATSATLKFAKVPVGGSPDTIKTTATTASSDVTDVWYGVNVDPTQASGSYSDAVTYTATANP
jgi:hypothetical protein